MDDLQKPIRNGEEIGTSANQATPTHQAQLRKIFFPGTVKFCFRDWMFLNPPPPALCEKRRRPFLPAFFVLVLLG